MAAASAYRDLVLGDAPLRYYRLGETSGTTAVDSTGNSNGAYQTGGILGATSLLTGDSDLAYRPNGAGGVLCTNPGLSGDFTAEYWFVRPANTSSVQMLGLNAGSPSFFQTFLFNLGGYGGGGVNKLAFGYGQSASGFSALFGPVITLGQLYHIVGTYTASSGLWILYVNGPEFSRRTTAVAPPYNQAGELLMIGYNYNGGVPGSWFDGTIDEVAVYNRVLAPDEVLHHYTVGIGQRTLATMGVG